MYIYLRAVLAGVIDMGSSNDESPMRGENEKGKNKHQIVRGGCEVRRCDVSGSNFNADLTHIIFANFTALRFFFTTSVMALSSRVTKILHSVDH